MKDGGSTMSRTCGQTLLGHERVRRVLVLPVLVAWIVASATQGCSSRLFLLTDYDHEQRDDLEAYQTYQWVSEDPENPIGEDEAVARAMVDLVLASRAYSQVSTDADFKIDVHIATDSNLDLSGLNDRYRGSAGQWTSVGGGAGEFSLRIYKQGALAVDVIDAESGDLVWRGLVEADLPPRLSEESAEALLEEAVTKIMDRFPPSREEG